MKPETHHFLRLLLGSYSPADAEGIRLYDFDQETGEAQYVSGLKGIANPSYLCHAGSDSLFLAVSETDDGHDALCLFQLTTDGQQATMQLLASQPTLGKAPCYVNYHPATSQAFTANYNGGSLTTFQVNPAEGTLGEPQVTQYEGSGPFLPNQQQSHIHCVQFSPDSTTLYVCDLGADRIRVLQVPMQGSGSKSEALVSGFKSEALVSGSKSEALVSSFKSQTPLKPETLKPETLKPEILLPPGTGPRHLIFSADGRFAYLIGELSGYVTVLSNQGNTLTPIQYALCDSVGGHGSADIHLSLDGRYLYASNRLKEDGISIFSVDPESGLVTKVGYQLTGIHPRNFAITPNGRFLLCACRDSHEVQIYAIDPQSGLLSPTGQAIQMPQPVFVMMMRP